jgi:hypothetical protein
MYKLIFLIATMAIVNSYAQVELECKTEEVDSVTITQLPWFGKNDWLLQYVDSIETPFNCINCRFGLDGQSKTIYQIPVNAIVYFNSSFPNINNSQVERYINIANQFFRTE